MGWRGSGGECMTMVAGIVFRPDAGRHRAGTRPASTVVTGDGFAERRGWATGGIDSTPATWRQRGVVSGGRCGGNPPAQGRAKGPTAQLQWSVVSGVVRGTALALFEDANWLWVGPLQQEVYESSPPVWTAAILGICLLTPPNCDSMNQAILDHIDTGKPYARLHRMRYLESRR